MNRRLGLSAGLGSFALVLGATNMATATAATAGSADSTAASVHTEELTWTELRDRIAGGATTLLVPVGGTEQSGPHMVLGKHNVRVRAIAGQIAQALGHTLVAPVLAHVPEGALKPPTQHMRYPGTVSIPAAAFEAVLEATARSFTLHGVRHVVLLGDHGGYQANLVAVAARLNRAWASESKAGESKAGGPMPQAHALTTYYQTTQTAFVTELQRQGFRPAQIGQHAGLADTALSLAIDPALVRTGQLARTAPDAEGVTGDPRAATAELGRAGVRLVVEASVAELRRLTR
jgi:creatinine amidohydrolase/Fe(II)-dependent formamide hydrolase-like protein